jgi:hypothetical protein
MYYTEGLNPLISFPLDLDRPHFLAAHSIHSTAPFMFSHALFSGCLLLAAYFAHLIHCQSIRLAELEKDRIAAQADADVVAENFRMMEKAHQRETRTVKQKFENITSCAEKADRLAKEANGYFVVIWKRIDALEKERVYDEEKQFDQIANTTAQSERAWQKDRNDLKLNYEKLAVKLRREMSEKVEAANKRAEDAEDELLRKLEENDRARSKELALYQVAVTTTEARLWAGIQKSEKRNLRLATEMTEKNEKQTRKGSVERAAHHARELNQLRLEDDERQEALLSCIAEAIMKDEDARMKEKKMQEEARLVEKEQERAVLSKMHSAIVEVKSKSLALSTEQWQERRELRDHLTSLSEDVRDCQKALEIVRKARRINVDIGGRERGKAGIPRSTALCNAQPAGSSLQGLLTPAPSQSPPPREVLAAPPLDQAAPIIGNRASEVDVAPASEVQVKLEDTSFDLEHAAVHDFLDSEAKIRLGTSNGDCFVWTPGLHES